MNDFQAYLDQNLKKIDTRPQRQEAKVPEYDIFIEIQDAIHALRGELGITQKELAEISGLTQSNISKIESGACHPTIVSLKKIADAAGRKLSIQFIDIQETIEYD